jgi:molybdopterin-guanine dinucleotide biosynthesis protein A/uridine kinase
MTERVGAIVLAGGRSSRFGRDKLAELIDGRPLLDHAIAAVRVVATDIVVVAAPAANLTVPPGVRVAHDPVAFEGPLAGLAAGLAALDPSVDRLIVVAGDMPSLVPAVLRRLLDAVMAGRAAALLGVDGDPPPLPMALDRPRAAAATGRLIEAGETRLRALPSALDAEVVPTSVWRYDDPVGATFRDVDTPADLPLDTRWTSIVQQIADRIVGLLPGHRILVAIDGVDGAGKTTLANALAALVAGRRPVVRASIDDFHRPAVERWARGRDSPEGFFRDSFDYDGLANDLLDPFRAGGEILTAIHDVVADAPRSVSAGIPAQNAVLILDGIFLHRAELVDRWDLSIYLDVDFPVSIPRGARRGFGDPDPSATSNRRYIEGQRLYLAEADPASRATIVVDATDIDRPQVIKYGGYIDDAR